MSTAENIGLLDEVYPLSDEQVSFYQKKGYIKLKDVLSAEIINQYKKHISKLVIEQNTMHLPMEERDTYDKAFLQITNLWTTDKEVKEFVFGKRLAQIATTLMQVGGVRLYHDQALYKEAKGGFTPWHADQFYWPLDSPKTITVWIPLQKTSTQMGALEFSAGSQHFNFGRDMAISDDSEANIETALSKEGFDHIVEDFDLGEVSFHAGWTFHRAGPNKSDNPRAVMTIIYMDKDIRLKQPENDNQVADYEAFCAGAKIGEVVDTKLNPILHEN